MPPLRRAIRLAVRAAPPLVGAGLAAAILAGEFAELARMGPWHALLLLALLVSLLALGRMRMRHGARDLPLSRGTEAEFGALLLLGAFALSQPLGGVFSPLQPLVYLVMAFVVGFLPTGVGLALTAAAVLFDVAVFAAAGALPAAWSTAFVHAFFLLSFAGLNLVAQKTSGRAVGEVVREHVRALEERARRYRLGMDDGEQDDALGGFDADRWRTASVKEVEEAVGNALEVAECALHTHTIAVFLLHDDETTVHLHDCRSEADDVVRDAFDAREGILGAVLKRRQPMRLCGELKGISWYRGRHPVRSALVVPLVDRRRPVPGHEEGRLRGLLVADRLDGVPFDDDAERLLEATSREVLRAMDVERIMGLITKARAEKERFFSAIQALNGASKLSEVYEVTLREARRAAEVDFVAITTVRSDENGRLVHKIDRIEGSEAHRKLEGREFADEGGLVANVVRFVRTLPARELRPNERPQLFDATLVVKGLRSLRIVPVVASGVVTGTLVCGSRRERAFDADAVRMLETIGMQVGQAIDRARLLDETERMATTDGLTGLLNHRTFQTRFDSELARAARGGKVTLVLTDIDHFKSVNDTYGHATGDAVLKGVAKILQRCARTTDVVARYGGEEFALILPDTDMAGGKVIAERIREAVQAHEFHTELGPLRCTLSLGVASYPDVSTDKQELFEKADQCLYHCKRMGRNRTTTVDETTPEGLLAVG